MNDNLSISDPKKKERADNGIRTRDPELGKLVLYH
jgi:hypothetical protein